MEEIVCLGEFASIGIKTNAHGGYSGGMWFSNLFVGCNIETQAKRR